MVRGWRRALSVPVAGLLAGLVFLLVLNTLPADDTTDEGYVADTWFTGHFVGHLLWAGIAAGLAWFLYSTRVPRTWHDAWRQEPGAALAFLGLCLFVLAQLVEAWSATSMGYSTNDGKHDVAIIFFGMPSEIIIVVGLLIWGVMALRRILRGEKRNPTNVG